MPPTLVPASRRALGPLLVLGIVGLIAAIAAYSFLGNRSTDSDEVRFGGLMGSGRTFYEKGDAARAVDLFEQARSMNPANPDVHLNLANAHLHGGWGWSPMEATDIGPEAGRLLGGS